MCAECARQKAALRRSKLKKPAVKSQRQIAKDAGYVRYSTGKPCVVGHVAERFTSSGGCCACLDIKQKDFIQNNAEQHRQNNKRWNEKNVDKVRKMKRPANANRRANLLHRTPKWLSEQDKMRIKVKHAEARWMTEHTGISHAVDHIYPLQGRLVSGLHVPSNMRVIPARENSRKYNKLIHT